MDSYPHNYYLKNIVTCAGAHGHYWDEYVSGSITDDSLKGLKKPVPVNDVFGFGGDTRDLVSDVHHTTLLAKNIVAGA